MPGFVIYPFGKGQHLLLCWLGRESGRTPLEFEALLLFALPLLFTLAKLDAILDAAL